MSRTIVDGVPYRTVRTLPSPNTNCGPPAELGEPQLPPPQDSLPTLHPAPDARSGNPFSCESPRVFDRSKSYDRKTFAAVVSFEELAK